jgi:hypothetical protein
MFRVAVLLADMLRAAMCAEYLPMLTITKARKTERQNVYENEI